ncbi:MAG: class I SAM-dependent methyltransferase [Bacillota bacterium]|nr:class I SAM-dependent methyltransferase [Bacillota bacterium]
MTNKIKVATGSVAETLIIPLYGRKLCSQIYPQLFQDEEAAGAIEKLDYDFSFLAKKMNKYFYRFGILEVAMRQYDAKLEIEEYLSKHPKAAVVNLGCGLDRSGESSSNGQCHIYNVDFPDVIKLRESLFPPKENETSIAGNLNEYSWMEGIDASHGAIFFALGVFYYLSREEVESLILSLSKRFPGARLIFDIGSKKAVKTMNKQYLKKGKMKVSSLFYLNDISELSAISKDIAVSGKGYMLGYVDLRKDKKIPWLFRFMCKLADGPIYKMKIVSVDFLAEDIKAL